MLESLRDGAVIFKQLRRNALTKGDGFTGSLHCEIVIASLIKLMSLLSRDSAAATVTGPGMGDILKEFEVSCIVSAIQDAS